MKQRISLWSLVALAIVLAVASCSRMNDNYKPYVKDGEYIYSKKPDTVLLYPGQNRVAITLVLIEAPRVNRVRIYWHNHEDSIEVPVTPVSGTDSINVSIDNLAEGLYAFDIYSYDASGNASIVESISGQVYGNNYIGSLVNRSIQNAALSGGQPRIAWGQQPDTTALGQQIRYYDASGQLKELWVPDSIEITRIAERPQGDSISYRTAFKPVKGAIDTFYSDYQTLVLEPPTPVALDKSKFADFPLPTDAGIYGAAYPMTKLWDDDLTNWYETAKNSGHPHWFTFDMGVTASLDHFMWWQRGDKTSLYFANASPSEWEIYGSNDPNSSGSFDDSWVLLGTFHSFKPSGEPVGTNTDEDIAYAKAGELFTFPQPTIPVRYLRFKIVETWAPANDDHAFITELTLYGVPE